MIRPVTITSLLFLIIYEIVFVVKLKLKICSRNDKSTPKWEYIITVICGGTGVYAGKLLARIDNLELKAWILVVLASIFIAKSVDFFQRYLVYKIYTYKNC